MESKKWKEVELSIERVFDDEEEKKLAVYPYRAPDRVDYVVHMVLPSGEDALVFDTTVTCNKNVVSDWIGAVRGPDRRSVRSPRVVGISFYKGAFSHPRRHNGGGQHPPPLPTIAALSICVGGSRCLVYVVDRDDLCPARGGGPHSFVSRQLREFLENRSVSFVGFGIEKAIATLKVEWGVDVAKPVDAMKLATDAVEKGRYVFELETRKGKANRRSAGHVLAFPASKEEIMAMATGVKVDEPPRSVKEADWAANDFEYLTEEGQETVMHAAADALMSFQVGEALLKKN